MTFKVYVMGFDPYFVDIETIDDLAQLGDMYTLCDVKINFRNMTITIE